jgi:hypothetical protein
MECGTSGTQEEDGNSSLLAQSSTQSEMTKPKTINVTPTTHKALRDYCLAAGLKLQAVADKAIQAWLRKAAK